MKALVVGGAGFIGYRLVRRLLKEGHYVRVLDLKHGRLKRLSSPNLKLILGSMTDNQKVRRVMKGIDVVYHLALAGGFSIRSLKGFNTNLHGTLNLLRSAKSQRIRQFIHTSSTAVYGKPRYLPVDEEHPCNPEEESGWRLYPLMKFSTEKLCRLFYFTFELPVTVLRPTYVFCDKSIYEAPWIDWMTEKAKRNEPIEVIEGEGFASVHVDELVEAFMLATLNENAIGQVFNVVNPNTFVTYYEIAQHVVKEAGSKSKIRVVKSSELVNSMPTSSEKIQKILGWKPWVTRTEAINPKKRKS
jgi:nucleoside-diphosphate-sugar epimerase